VKGEVYVFDFMLSGDQKLLRQEVRDFVRQVPKQLLMDMDEEKIQYPREYIESLAERNLIGLRFPKQLGGRGLSWTEEIIALEEVGILGTSLGCLFSLPSIIGEAIDKFGTSEQQEKYLKRIISGEITVAEGLTEPRGGSDFFGTTTKARREGDHYIIRGQKRFVVGAEGADLFLIYARTNEEVPAHKGISTFLVERGPDVKVEYLYGLMGTRGGGAGRVIFDDVKVPAENLVGQKDGAAGIFYQMMIPERLTSAAGALGMARAALEVAAKYSDRRKAFGQKIRKYEAVSFKVADSITKLDAARAIVHAAAQAVDNGAPAGVARRMVSEAKKFATDSAWEIVNHAMQIMGGIGYTNVYPIERLLRDIRLIMIWTGTNEIMDLIIQSEYYKEMGAAGPATRDVEADAVNADAVEEKVYE